MNKEKIATNTTTEFLYQTDGSILIVRFRGFLKPGEAAKDRLVINEAIHQKKVQLILINQRDIKVLSREMQSFIMNNAPEMVQMGIKKMAIVLPEDVFALAGVSKIQNESNIRGIEMGTFISEEAGLNWLRANS
jgi:hypothetical protein